MNRAELRWMLDSALPHVGSASAGLDVLGLDVGSGSANAFATDRYTFAVADVDDDGPRLFVNLPVKEARDLLKFIRPTRVAHDDEPVRLLHVDNELHVGIKDDSAVFDVLPDPSLTLCTLQLFFAKLSATPREWNQQIYQPSLFARFAKAQREDHDRLRMYPHRANDQYGAALVTVGDHFMGAIAGLTYDEAEAPVLTVKEQAA